MESAHNKQIHHGAANTDNTTKLKNVMEMFPGTVQVNKAAVIISSDENIYFNIPGPSIQSLKVLLLFGDFCLCCILFWLCCQYLSFFSCNLQSNFCGVLFSSMCLQNFPERSPIMCI